MTNVYSSTVALTTLCLALSVNQLPFSPHEDDDYNTMTADDVQPTSLPQQQHPSAALKEEYPINFDKETEPRNSPRHLTKVTIVEAGQASQSVELPTLRKPFLFIEKPTFTIHASSTITPSITWGGEWMHHYFYIDLDDNKAFDVVDANSPELVSFNHDQGKNKAGQPSKDNPSMDTLELPSFTSPATPGTYRMRVKVDWNNVDPTGQRNIENDILNNRGSITDFLLKVVAPSGISPLEENHNKPRYDLSGRRTNGTHRLYIENGTKHLPNRR